MWEDTGYTHYVSTHKKHSERRSLFIPKTLQWNVFQFLLTANMNSSQIFPSYCHVNVIRFSVFIQIQISFSVSRDGGNQCQLEIQISSLRLPNYDNWWWFHWGSIASLKINLGPCVIYQLKGWHDGRMIGGKCHNSDRLQAAPHHRPPAAPVCLLAELASYFLLVLSLRPYHGSLHSLFYDGHIHHDKHWYMRSEEVSPICLSSLYLSPVSCLVSPVSTLTMIDEQCGAQLYACITYW